METSMMLEQQIDLALRSLLFVVTCKDWKWYSKSKANAPVLGTRRFVRINIPIEVSTLIEQADLVECLTSPSEYVREYRKAYEASKST